MQQPTISLPDELRAVSRVSLEVRLPISTHQGCVSPRRSQRRCVLVNKCTKWAQTVSEQCGMHSGNGPSHASSGAHKVNITLEYCCYTVFLPQDYVQARIRQFSKIFAGHLRPEAPPAAVEEAFSQALHALGSDTNKEVEGFCTRFRHKCR